MRDGRRCLTPSTPYLYSVDLSIHESPEYTLEGIQLLPLWVGMVVTQPLMAHEQ